MSNRNEPETLFALEIQLMMSSLLEREEEVMDLRYVKGELKATRFPSERVIGPYCPWSFQCLFSECGELLFLIFSTVPAYICSPNFFKWIMDNFAVLIASLQVGRINTILLT